MADDPGANDRGANDPGMKGRRNSSRRKLAGDRGGSISVENAIVFGLLIVLTVSLIEFSLALWQWNTAEKATELGVRYAVQSDPVATNIANYNGVTDGGFSPGTDLEKTSLGFFVVRCDGSGCSCLDGDCSVVQNIQAQDPDSTGSFGFKKANFDAIVRRMDGVFRGSDLGPDNVTIDYSYVGMGFAGRPGPDIVPAVTVRLTGVTFDFMILSFIRPLLFYGSVQPTTSGIPMPPFTATLSGEDMNSAGAS